MRLANFLLTTHTYISQNKQTILTDLSTGGDSSLNCNKSSISFIKSILGISIEGLALLDESKSSGDIGWEFGLNGLYDLSSTK